MLTAYELLTLKCEHTQLLKGCFEKLKQENSEVFRSFQIELNHIIGMLINNPNKIGAMYYPSETEKTLILGMIYYLRSKGYTTIYEDRHKAIYFGIQPYNDDPKNLISFYHFRSIKS